jgi:hypothetical protein
MTSHLPMVMRFKLAGKVIRRNRGIVRKDIQEEKG